jgi:hypothetical protein
MTPHVPRRSPKFVLTVDHLLIALGVVAVLVLVVAFFRNSNGDNQNISPGKPFPLSIVVGDRTVVATCVVHDRRVRLTLGNQGVANTANNTYLIAQAAATEALGLNAVLSGNTTTQAVTNIPGIGLDVLVTRYALSSGAFYVCPAVRDSNIIGVTCWLDQ